VITEQGMGAPVAEIARRAGVSKQTLYNHYGGKAGLVQVLILRRVEYFAEPLAEPGRTSPEAALTAFARRLMPAFLGAAYLKLVRVAIRGAAEAPELARIVYETGANATRARLADYLRAEHAAGRLSVPDADMAADFFVGMLNSRQVSGLVSETAQTGDSDARCAEIARRFVRAYAPG
jgi:AcrR family transcriptional regulator